VRLLYHQQGHETIPLLADPAQPLLSAELYSQGISPRLDEAADSIFGAPGVIPYSIPVTFPALSLFIPCYEFHSITRKS